MNIKEATIFLGAIYLDSSKRIPFGIISKEKIKVGERKLRLTKKSPEFIIIQKVDGLLCIRIKFIRDQES